VTATMLAKKNPQARRSTKGAVLQFGGDRVTPNPAPTSTTLLTLPKAALNRQLGCPVLGRARGRGTAPGRNCKQEKAQGVGAPQALEYRQITGQADAGFLAPAQWTLIASIRINTPKLHHMVRLCNTFLSILCFARSPPCQQRVSIQLGKGCLNLHRLLTSRTVAPLVVRHGLGSRRLYFSVT